MRKTRPFLRENLHVRRKSVTFVAMNISNLVSVYFSGSECPPMIEVFDKSTIHTTFTDVVRMLNDFPDIELGVLQALSYCLYEILDNVITHSERLSGTAMMRYTKDEKRIEVLVADDGIGIHRTLTTNPTYAGITEAEAVSRCVEDNVTDGKGMGFGLYSTLRLVDNAGVTLRIHSGRSMLVYENATARTETVQQWNGTIVYFELHSDKQIVPNDIVENRTDCEGQYNELFAPADNIKELW